MESKGRPELKRSRYLWLRNEPSLSAESREQLAGLTRLHLKTARAYQLRLAFQEIYKQPTLQWGELFLDRWYGWAIRCRLEPIKRVARMIKRHLQGILNAVVTGITNARCEGLNARIQWLKSTACGFRNRHLGLMRIVFRLP